MSSCSGTLYLGISIGFGVSTPFGDEILLMLSSSVSPELTYILSFFPSLGPVLGVLSNRKGVFFLSGVAIYLSVYELLF